MIKASSQSAAPSDPQKLLSEIAQFLKRCARPAVLDFGDTPIPLVRDRYLLELRSGKLVIDAWDEARSLSRRILTLDRICPGLLDCTVQRFAGATGTLTFLDQDRPQTAARTIRGTRQNFAEQFRRMLSRQFPGWAIERLSSALDLRRSLSAVFPRACLTRGSQRIAALACPSIDHEPAFLSSALLWHDHLSCETPPPGQVSLCVFLPEQAGNITAHRLHWLTGKTLAARMFLFNEHGMAGEVDSRDLGNLDTRLSSHYAAPPQAPGLKLLLERMHTIRGVGCCPEVSGAISVRFRGLEFARIEGGSRILLGIDARAEVLPADLQKVEDFASHLSRLAFPANSLLAGGSNLSELPAFPERWFESAVRSNLHAIAPDLLADWVHGQVLTFAGGERELIDLLAISSSGRLTVLELKTSEDLQLPMQGLDYWMRIRWHANRGELNHLFPGLRVSDQAPKLLLVAPALAFHPANEIVLRYFSPHIEVQRVGVNSDWESALKVAFQLSGADVPISHRGKHNARRSDEHKKSAHRAESE